MKQAAERLKQAVGAGIFLTDEPMSRHTTFRTGGPADIYIEPSGVEELKQVLDICREENVAYTIIGNGSNLLVGDGGYRGVLISFGKPFAQVTIEGAQVRTGAGALLSAVAKQVLNASLTGFEFAAGIPGTIGGAVVMNAGAYGGELCQVLREATVLTPEGEVKHFQQKNWNWATGPAASRKTVILCWRQCFSCSRETLMTSVWSWMIWHQNAVKSSHWNTRVQAVPSSARKAISQAD